MKRDEHPHGFGEKQLAEATEIAKQIFQLNDNDRPRLRGVCIDGAKSLDRDDAIWITMDEAGRLVVEVAIADIGAALPLATLLDGEAKQRTSSVYRDQSVKTPMLPFVLSQDQGEGFGYLSLSDRGARLGLTTRVTLNPDNGQFTKIELIPCVIEAEVADYETVHARAQGEDAVVMPRSRAAFEKANDGPDRYRIWGAVAQLLREARRSGRDGFIPVYQERDGRIVETTEEGEMLEYSRSELDARRIVEETALLANRANARLASRCELPFPFRIHSARVVGDPHARVFYRLNDASEVQMALQGGRGLREGDLKIVLNWAEYSHLPLPHIGLGFNAYAHTTSPIRRYPDIIAQRMEHWLVKVNAALAQHLAEAGAQEKNAIADRLWVSQAIRREEVTDATLRGDLLAKAVYNLRAADSAAANELAQDHLAKHLGGALRLLGVEEKERGAAIRHIAAALEADTALIVPYTRAEMALLCRQQSQSMHAMRGSERQKAELALQYGLQEQLTRMKQEVLTLLHEGDIDGMRVLSQPRFTALMTMAAATQQVQRIPARLAEERFRQRKLLEPGDLAIIIAEILPPKAPEQEQAAQEWIALKEKIIATRFLDNPAHAKGFFNELEQRYGWTLHTSNTTLIDDYEAGKGPVAAVVSLKRRDDAPQEVPPVFSIGYWGKSTRHHARIAFLHALSRGELQPDHPRLPTALELMIYDADHIRAFDDVACAQIDQLAHENGIFVAGEWDAAQQRYRLEVELQDSEGETVIRRFEGRHFSRHWARHLAYQQLMLTHLMKPVQARLFARHERLEQFPLNADDAVAAIGEAIRSGPHSNSFILDCEVARSNKRTERNEEIWEATGTLGVQAAWRRQFEAQSTQKEVAMTLLNEEILEYMMARAEQGDSAFKALLDAYQQRIVDHYQGFAPGEQVIFADRVPFSAQMQAGPHYDIIRPAETQTGESHASA